MRKGTGVLAAVLVVVAVGIAFAATTATAQTKKQVAAGAALIKCGKTVKIGAAIPITGPAASIGIDQLHWAQFFVTRWNATHKKLKVSMAQGDTQLPNVAAATSVAQTFASDSKLLGVVGPAGSQEVIGTTAIFRGAGLGFVSGSATKTTLTDGSRKGFFFRVVPTDAQQGPRIAAYATSKLKVKRTRFIIPWDAITKDPNANSPAIHRFSQYVCTDAGTRDRLASISSTNAQNRAKGTDGLGERCVSIGPKFSNSRRLV